MNHWYEQIQIMTGAIDEAIENDCDDALTLEHLADQLGYSKFHATRMFHEIGGMTFREYLRRRRLAYALVQVRDTEHSLLDIAVRYGFSSQEAFSRAFRQAYGVAPAAFRKAPGPVVLRTRIHPFDRYLATTGGTNMAEPNEEIRTYFVRIPAHRFLHIKNYESNGYFDFWEKQDAIAGQDCDTICGLLGSIPGKLDGNDSTLASFNGQIMGYPQEADGRRPEAYGIRLPAAWEGSIPAQMLLLDVPEGDWLVFEHGPFDFQTQCESIEQAIDARIQSYEWTGIDYEPDPSPGRIEYFYNDPERFLKRLIPVRKIG